MNRGAFLAAVGTDWRINLERLGDLTVCCCGGQGLFLNKLNGEGMAFLNAGGTVLVKQLAPGEEVVIDTWVSNFGKTRSLRKYLIRRPADDCVLVTAETNWALVDIAKRRPRRIPQEIIDAFTLVPECEEPKPKPAPEPARSE